MPEVSALDAALERIQADAQTVTDLEALRRALRTGQITITSASGSRGVTIGGNADRAVILTGDGNQVVVQGMSAEMLRQILSSQPTLDPRERRDRSRMLQRVRRTWIEGFLEDSLHGAALQALGLEKRPEAVPDRWGMVVQQPGSACPNAPVTFFAVV